MELSQLRYFQALANIRHFTQAAESCAISQSALSRAIAKLEDELHTPLFRRRAKGVDLTPAGEHFLYHVDRILRELDAATEEILEAGQTDTQGQSMKLSFLHSFGNYVVPMILPEFQARYPDIRIQLDQTNSTVIARQVEAGETDLALCSTMTTAEHVAWMYLWSEELFVAVPKDHPLAERENVNLREIEGEPFITLKPDYSLRKLIDQSFELAQCHPKIVFEGDDVNTLASFVAAKLGVSLIPRIPGIEHFGIVYVPVSFPTVRRAVGLAWNTNHPLSPAAMAFHQFVMRRFAENQPAGFSAPESAASGRIAARKRKRK